MTNTKPVRRRQPGRIFPEFTLPPEELARRRDERNARCQKARIVFDKVCPQLINEHYNWFIVIEPNSGDYFVDADENAAEKRAREKCPTGWLVTFRLNETGACGRI